MATRVFPELRREAEPDTEGPEPPLPTPADPASRTVPASGLASSCAPPLPAPEDAATRAAEGAPTLPVTEPQTWRWLD